MTYAPYKLLIHYFYLFSKPEVLESATEVSQLKISAPMLQQSPAILEYADVELEVEGKTVKASKSLLCMVSPVLKKMLEGNFKEAELAKIPLPEKSYSDIVEFIEVTHLQKAITSKNVYEILPIAHEYDCNNLVKRCEEVLLSGPVSLKNYHVADTYGLEELYRKTLNDLKGQNYFKVKSASQEVYQDLEKQAKIDYLEAILESLKPKQREVWGKR